MAFKRAHVEKWAAAQLPGEQFVSYTGTAIIAISHTIPTAGSTSPRSSGERGDELRLALADSLGLDREQQAGRGHSATFYVITDRQLALGTRSSARNRPKDLLHAAPIADVRVHWFDHDSGAGNVFRHFVTEFGDGMWRADKTGLRVLGRAVTSSNADHYIEALGERAIEAPAT